MMISVVIATYARPEGLRKAVRSLDRQTRPPEEIVAVALSKDAVTLQTLEDLGRGRAPGVLPVLRPVIVDDPDLGAKENAGMRAALGDILCFMDDDAEARPEWLERLEVHYRDPAVGAVGGRDVISLEGCVLERDARTVGRIQWLGRVTGNHHERVRGCREVDFLKGCNMSYRREALRPIDGRLAGPVPFGFEIDLGLHVRRRGWRVLYDPDVLVDHYPTRTYRADSQEIAWVVNHNQTYVLLKHLTWPRKLAFLAYTFGVGDKNTIGLARVPYLALRKRWSSAAIKAQFAGKIAGIRTYVGTARCKEEG